MEQVFLSYARDDGKAARRLYDDLRRSGPMHVWFDRVDLLPGMEWKPAIRKAIRESRFFVALLSKSSVANRGYRHTELRQALEVKDEFPRAKTYLVPARLDNCRMPFV